MNNIFQSLKVIKVSEIDRNTGFFWGILNADNADHTDFRW